MSRTLLSRIKPRPKNPTSSSPYARFKPHTKTLVNEICQILSTHNNTQWQDTLETLLSEQETAPSDITHFVLDRIRDPELGLKFFDWVSNRPYGCSLDGFAYSSLLKLLARSRVFPEIERLMGVMRVEDKVPSREALDDVIGAYSDSGLAGKAVEFYRVFVSMYGYVPSVIGFNSLLDVIVKRGWIDVARQVYDEMMGREDGCVDNYSTCIMVRGLCKEGKVEEGRKLIEDRWGKGCVPNIVFYNTLIDGYCKKGDVEGAYALFKELKLKGFLPAVETYGAMINGFCKGGIFGAVDRLLVEMNARGLNVNVHVYNSVIDARYRHGCVVKAEETVRKMIDSGCEPDIVTFNTLINDAFVYATLVDGFVRNGDLNEAKRLFELTIENGVNPGVVGFNTMIKGYSKFGMMNDAVSCINRMMKRRISPDEYTYSIMVDGYVKQHDLDGALRMFTQMVKRKCKPNVVTYTSLINGFCLKGDFHGAENVFSEMKSCGLVPNVVTYSVLIRSFCKDGKLVKAVSFFEQMLRSKCIPNDVTFHYLVTGFSHNARFINEKKGNEVCECEMSVFFAIFGMMISDGWDPRIAAYSSILVCLCLYGMLKTALQLRDKMVTKALNSYSVTFAALLHGNCVEGRSREWKSIITCNLNELERQVALKYSLLIDQYLPKEVTSEASHILHTLVEDYRSHDKEISNLKVRHWATVRMQLLCIVRIFDACYSVNMLDYGCKHAHGHMAHKLVTGQAVCLFSVSGIRVTFALIQWKTSICITSSVSPIVVLSGSMEPGFQKGTTIFTMIEVSMRMVSSGFSRIILRILDLWQDHCGVVGLVDTVVVFKIFLGDSHPQVLHSSTLGESTSLALFKGGGEGLESSDPAEGLVQSFSSLSGLYRPTEAVSSVRTALISLFPDN
ncbi:hypothetical protein RHGRI_024880 [Rhododendron griersonianum]|uniref:Pentatricopeptide repeat-containing protein n=1 Tax=Rhododendron griersonianum TaxID=479676 RepID=A0AAV6J8S8_9ERIC|nr:hypothetical protein RHGRI_024880 [Rhododendron griersonianum]